MDVRRVLFVTNMYPVPDRASFGIIVARVAAELKRRGVDVRVEAISGYLDRSDYWRARRRVAAATADFRPEVVHVHFGWSFVATSNATPRVVSFYGDDLNGTATSTGGTTFISRAGIAVSQWAALRAERTIAVSEALRARLRFARARERCTVIRDAVDQALFVPGSQRTARERLAIHDDVARVLFPHAVSQPTKRLDLAQAAVERLNRRGRPATLWVVNGVPPEEMPLYYQAADAMIVTSDREGGPSSVKEAMACGLPVVSVPVGDTEAIVRAKGRAILATRDPDDLARALEKAIATGRDDRSAYLPHELTLSHAGERIAEVYERAIAGHRRSSFA